MLFRSSFGAARGGWLGTFKGKGFPSLSCGGPAVGIMFEAINDEGIAAMDALNCSRARSFLVEAKKTLIESNFDELRSHGLPGCLGMNWSEADKRVDPDGWVDTRSPCEHL